MPSSGSYTGNGTRLSFELGFKPMCVKILSTDGTYSVVRFRDRPHVGMIGIGQTISYRYLSVPEADGITLNSNGFYVETSAAVNESGRSYVWEAF